MGELFSGMRYIHTATKLIKLLCIMKTALTVATIVFTVFESVKVIKQLKP